MIEHISFHHQQIMDAETYQPVASELLLRSGKPLSADTLNQLLVSDVEALTRCKVETALRLNYDAVFLNFSRRQLAARQFMLALDHLVHLTLFTTVVIEVTECMLSYCASRYHKHLQQIHDAGILLAIDDLGRGHSNLAAVKMSPPPALVKLDMSLLRSAMRNRSHAVMYKQLIANLHRRGFRVVCEGVETAKEAQLACAAGGDLLQGYFFHRPQAVAQKIEQPDLARPHAPTQASPC
ncbi:EAL domain-containing protein [Pseudoalteromonas rubra]|uniref:EAL domain-containing protein n=1 Tax=Pseudoalteromonas rubra TaxID=43658 RepID=A0A0U3HX08_9GAMM|nr:EAL domain-containing protein [Pseudoalteromonas rubra]ALU46137.1 hypothetical protein AT705_24555 [Pseudoalteromonas rubra]